MSSPATEIYLNSAQFFCKKEFAANIKTNVAPHKDLGWNPSFWFSDKVSLTIVEVSEQKILPTIAQLSEGDISHIDVPISVYIACPEELYLDKKSQSDIKKNAKKGYGYLSIAEDGVCTLRNLAVPLIQAHNDKEVEERIKAIPVASARNRSKLAYNKYKNDPKSGLSELAEIVEDCVIKASKKAEAKINGNGDPWVPTDTCKRGINEQLKRMQQSPQMNAHSAAIGGAQSFYGKVRNKTNHAPRTKLAAAKRTREIKTDFIRGLETVSEFTDAMNKLDIKFRI